MFLDSLAPALAAAGIAIVRWSDLSEADRKAMTEVYEERVFPVLTPLAVDPSHPFPYISDLALSVAAFVGDPETRRATLRPGEGARPVPPPRAGRRAALPARRGARHRPPRQPVRRHGDRGGGGVPGHPQRRPHRRGGGGRRPARGGRDGAAPPPLQPGRAPRGRRLDERRDARAARARARPAPQRRVPPARPDRPRLPVAAPRPRPPRPQGPAVAADHAGADRRRARSRAPDRRR